MKRKQIKFRKNSTGKIVFYAIILAVVMFYLGWQFGKIDGFQTCIESLISFPIQ